MSAAEPITVVSVALLLPGTGSVVVEVTVAVLLIVPVVEGAIATVRVKTALPTAMLAFVQVMVPPAPTAGVVHDQPAGEESATNVVPAGSVSERLTLAAELGPALLTVMV